MTDLVIQRVVTSPNARLRRLYYRFRRASANKLSLPRRSGRRSIVLQRGIVLRTDTWFNGLFENYWRKYTSIRQLALCVRVCGAGLLKLYRRTRTDGKQLLQALRFSGKDCELRMEVPEPSSAAEAGLLFFELKARTSRLLMRKADWLACSTEPEQVRLVVAFCTFNRAAILSRNVTRLLEDAELAEVLERVVVVDQGQERFREHPAFARLSRRAAGRLQLFEQANYGGAGGFTRCILEARRIPSATHVLLMDDDSVIEPECVRRSAVFLAMSSGGLAVGGHMLDADRPAEVVECGTHYRPEHVRIDEPRRQSVEGADGVTSFLSDVPRHYNGWWFFAFPLKALERTGLPLPLFLRGDDLEFGYRLLHHGVQTVTLPGLAVWHEPFERKGRSWHAYYELRNALIVGALYFQSIGALQLVRRFLSRLLDELLTYDYYDAWLMCAAADDYLRGPKMIRKLPGETHQRLLAMRERLGSAHRRAEDVSLVLSSTPRSPQRGMRLWRFHLLLRNLTWPEADEGSKPERLIHGGNEQWYDVAGTDVVAVAEPHQKDVLVLRRSRRRFVRLLVRGLWLGMRLLCGHRRVVREWQLAAREMMSTRFWFRYLGLSVTDSISTTGSRPQRQEVDQQ